MTNFKKRRIASISSASQVVLVTMNLPANAGDAGDLGWEDPMERTWQLTPAFLSGESHRQRNLASYSLKDPKESDVTEAT